jgi:hypothetical protein
MIYYTIYKVTNELNNKIYIGKHQTKNLDDGYLGSGKYITKAIKKHGKNNFNKEILFIFDNESDMNSKEIELITEEFVSSKDTYNVGIGGEGGPHFLGRKHSEESKKKMGRKGRTFTQEQRNKISLANKGRIFSEEHKRRISEKAKLRNLEKIARPNKQKETKKVKNYIMTEEHKRKISNSVIKANKINPNIVINQTAICPHCLKKGQKVAMHRYHFNKCKSLQREGQEG